MTYELAAIKQTATVLDLQDIKKDDTKDSIAGAIIDFLMFPTGKTVEEVQNDEPEEEEAEEEEEEEEEEVKPKGKKGRGGNANSGSRPKRATASRVWTNGENLYNRLCSAVIINIYVTFRLWKQRRRRDRRSPSSRWTQEARS